MLTDDLVRATYTNRPVTRATTGAAGAARRWAEIVDEIGRLQLAVDELQRVRSDRGNRFVDERGWPDAQVRPMREQLDRISPDPWGAAGTGGLGAAVAAATARRPPAHRLRLRGHGRSILTIRAQGPVTVGVRFPFRTHPRALVPAGSLAISSRKQALVLRGDLLLHESCRACRKLSHGIPAPRSHGKAVQRNHYRG